MRAVKVELGLGGGRGDVDFGQAAAAGEDPDNIRDAVLMVQGFDGGGLHAELDSRTREWGCE